MTPENSISSVGESVDFLRFQGMISTEKFDKSIRYFVGVDLSALCE